MARDYTIRLNKSKAKRRSLYITKTERIYLKSLELLEIFFVVFFCLNFLEGKE